MPGWNLRQPVEGVPVLVYALHYVGTGAVATYKDWPTVIGKAAIVPVQPPGRETRMSEEPLQTVDDYAEQLARHIAEDAAGRPYALAGHCGAVSYIAETVRAIGDLGAPPPGALVASSWGAPNARLYGRLNEVPLSDVDVTAEIQASSRERFGHQLDPELADIAGELLAQDLSTQRTFRARPNLRTQVPCEVIAWTRDRVVGPDSVWPGAWSDYAPSSPHVLVGDHWSYLSCPPALRDVIAATAAKVAWDARKATRP